MAIRLGFYYHIPATRHDGGLYMPGYQGRFVDSLAQYCSQVVCFLHSASHLDSEHMDYRVAGPNVTWVDLGPKASVPVLVFNSREYTRPIREWSSSLDAILIRGPSPLLPAAAKAAGKTPTALLLVGDYLAGVDDLPQPRWRKEAIRLWARWNKRQQMQVARHSLTFVNSRRLYDELSPGVPNLVETRTTTLSQSDFYEREDTCTSPPFHLLYSGRMSWTKGLLDMVEALAVLVGQGENVVLDLVGMPEKGENTLEELRLLAASKGVLERVTYHGYKPVGPELFAFYRRADIFVIASRSSFEGFPRVIWEAMAHSVPVVATRVGSIPFFLKDRETARIIPPRDPLLLAESVQELITSRDLRRALVRNGLHLARHNTLEDRSREMVTQVERWVSSQPAGET